MRGFSNIRMIEKLDKEMGILIAAIARGDRRSIKNALGMSAEDRMPHLRSLMSVLLSLLGKSWTLMYP